MNVDDQLSEDEVRGQNFAQWISGAASLRGWDKKALADAIGMSPSTIGIYFRGGLDKQTGKIRRPEEPTIEKIAAATGADENAGRLAAGYALKHGSAHEPTKIYLDTGDWFHVSPNDANPERTAKLAEAFLRSLRESGLREMREVG